MYILAIIRVMLCKKNISKVYIKKQYNNKSFYKNFGHLFLRQFLCGLLRFLCQILVDY